MKYAEAYQQKYHTDPTPCLETDYMTAYESGLETDNEIRKVAHSATLYAKAGFTQKQIQQNPRVWEKVTKLFRSQEVRNKRSPTHAERFHIFSSAL